MRASGIRTTQLTPIVSHKGETIGVLCTQFRRRHRPSDQELRLSDLLAWTAAEFIQRHKAEAALRESEARLRALVEGGSSAVLVQPGGTLGDGAPYRPGIYKGLISFFVPPCSAADPGRSVGRAGSART